MNIRLRLLSFVLVLLTIQSVQAQKTQAQPGYIVTHSYDTIPGLIENHKDLHKRVFFKLEHASAFQEFTPQDIRAFSYAENRFYSKEVTDRKKSVEHQFLLSLVDGALSLYQGSEFFYVEKHPGPLYSLKSMTTRQGSHVREDKRYMRTLAFLTSDCPFLREKVEQAKLYDQSLIDVVSSYNRCVDPDQKDSFTLDSEETAFNAHEGYIITYTSDTIFGMIKDRKDIYESVAFRPRGSSEFKEYSPADIRTFSYAGGYHYEAKEITQQDQQPSQLRFLLFLVGGELSLYQEAELLYVEKAGGPLYKLEQVDTQYDGTHMRKDKRYVRTLNYLTSDCSSLKKRVEQAKLHAASIIDVVVAYNRCINPDQDAELSVAPVKLKVRAGAKLGLASTQISYFLDGSVVRNYEFDKHLGYTGGALFDLSYNNKWSLRPEILLTKKGGSYRGFISRLYEEEIYFSLTTLQFPVSLFYTLPTPGVRPFVLAGGSIAFTVADRSYRTVSTLRYKEPTDHDQYGYRLGGGLALPAVRGRKWIFEYVYERSLTNGINSLSQVHFIVHHVTLGMVF